MRSIKPILLFVAASLAPVTVSAQQIGPVAPHIGAAFDGVTLPVDAQRKAIEMARQQTRLGRNEPAPKAFDPKNTEDLDAFARWAERTRGEREVAAALLGALDSKDIERLISEQERKALKASLTEQLANRDEWLDKATVAYFDKTKRDEDARRRSDMQPSFRAAGPPQPPRSPRMITSPQYMVAVEGLFPESLGAGLTGGNLPYRPGMGMGSPTPAEFGGKLLGKSVAILDVIQFGYSAGGWMGNEVIIHGQMRENFERKQKYEREFKDYEARRARWDAGGEGRKEWEDARAQEREWRDAASNRQQRTLYALFGRQSTVRPPPPMPKLEVPQAKKPAPESDFSRIPKQLQMMSTLKCHQPSSDTSGFRLSLSGFEGFGNNTSRRDNTTMDPALLRQLLSPPAGGTNGPAGTRR